MFDLTTRNIKYLTGVGPARAALLEKELGLRTLYDLLYYFPYKYVDRSRIYTINEIDGSMPYIQVKGKILSYEEAGEGRRLRVTAHFSDGTGVMDLVWFSGGKYARQLYKVGTEYVVFGRPGFYYGRPTIAHPEVEQPDYAPLVQGGLRPYYNTTERMKRMLLHSAALEKLMVQVVGMLTDVRYGQLPETLPPSLLRHYHLLRLDQALVSAHFPESAERLRQAQYRLKFEELLFIQLHILGYARDRQRHYRGYVFDHIGQPFNDFYAHHLPFELTGAQKRVIKEIRRDMATGRQMNRLLQGDVGSGKTLVALMSMLIAIGNGYQTCLMAPTEILAAQHHATLSRMLQGTGISVELLTGSVKGRRRDDILRRLLTGDVHILIGTHAVIEDPVSFSRLGFVVIDEQHRFGVAQRARLWGKSPQPPHVLVMTATPIPRTLAMTVYGDLDVSVIDELPPGRRPVMTLHQTDNQRSALLRSIRQQIDLGRQVYFVFPLITESEKVDLKNLEEGYLHICEAFPDLRVCKLHGRMKPAEKEQQMQLFSTGQAQILVSTTVIEVGVDVPNASVMVIENAERFGLAQLHQLRGRVGRGAEQSYCILVTRTKLTDDTRKRIDIMVHSNDGFVIAEADLNLRGPGDLQGTQQSGIAFDLKIANLARDGQILTQARDAARQLLEDDPDASLPENQPMWAKLDRLKKTQTNWSAIS